MAGTTQPGMQALHSRVYTPRSGSSKQPAHGTWKRDSAAKTKHSSTLARVAAGKKAARTRTRRAKVLKTLKTGKASFGVKE